ncbi:MAG: hypothetical protein JJU45_14465 [Acidimicrobiia bacterium]|nr:hypothetical protein [Acidimicrobiia bacterium]
MTAPDPPAESLPERDWFGQPVERPAEPVPCPQCGEPFTAAPDLAAHLSGAHGIATRRRPRAAPSRLTGANPTHRRALGQAPRSPLRQQLRTMPLWVVLCTNIIVAIAVFVILEEHGPPWWGELKPSWQRMALVPSMWPTALFLAFRGVD